MTRIEEITTKPDLNSYMSEVFNYHFERIVNNNYVENIVSDFIDIIEKDIKFRNGSQGNHKDIFEELDSDGIKNIKELESILSRFENEDNKFIKKIRKDINDKIDHIKNNKDKRIKNTFKSKHDLPTNVVIDTRVINPSVIIPRSNLYRNELGVKNIRVSFSPDNLLTFNLHFSEIYGDEKVNKIKRDFRKDYSSYNETPIRIMCKILNIDEDDQVLLEYKFDLDNIYYNMTTESKNKLNEMSDLINSVINYQIQIKNKNLKSTKVIEIIKNNSIMRKLQLDYESNNENKYEMEPIPRHLKKLFGKGEK
ncbi:hypothetical protein CPT_Madawaska_214 [Staphylococcus phage Madawaska]|nr:hypothetical protein CPT_Madawaska_214 [Staphylococcus phage Madawaska]